MKILLLLILGISLFGCIQINGVQPTPQTNQTQSNSTASIVDDSPLVLVAPPDCSDSYVRYTLNIKGVNDTPLDASVNLFTGENRIYSGFAQSGVFDACINRRVNSPVLSVIQKQGYLQSNKSVTIDQNSYNLYIDNVYLQQG